jgi:hypothetical protein
VNGRLIPNVDKNPPKTPCLPNAISNDNPATEGGKTIGKSINIWITCLPGKFHLASRYASGVPISSEIVTLIRLVTMLRRSAVNAVSENAFVKKSLPNARRKSAINGKPSRITSNKPGRTNNQSV